MLDSQGGHTCSDRCNGQGKAWTDLKAIVLQDEVLVHGDGHFDPAGGLGCAVPGTVHHRHTAPVRSEETIKHYKTRDSLSKEPRSTQFPALKGLRCCPKAGASLALQPAVTPWALQEAEDLRLVVTTTSQSCQPSGHTEGEAQVCPTASHDLHPQEPAASSPSEAAREHTALSFHWDPLQLMDVHCISTVCPFHPHADSQTSGKESSHGPESLVNAS